MPREFQELADALYRERVLRARHTPPEERLLDGVRLFSGVCDRMKIGLRLRHPAFTEAEIDTALRAQLRRLDAVQPAPHATPL